MADNTVLVNIICVSKMVENFADLRCFQHCRKDTDLVCFRVPDYCLLCHQCTATTESRIPPYVLPSPFSSSNRSPRAVVLKVTNGDFLRNYSRECNLHIGITDKNGSVCDFDEKGLNQGSVWPECLTVLTCISDQVHIWDHILTDFCNHSVLWHKTRYRENEWNCFDFVLQFLIQIRHLDVTGLTGMSKAEFCNNFLTRKTLRAEQYIHLYRQAMMTGCVAVPKNTS